MRINKDKEKALSWDRLTSLVEYSADSGVFTNKTSRGNMSNGSTAGHKRSDGYRWLMLDNIRYMEHRLAWYYTYKIWPEEILDHIDSIKDNNRINNLREATQSQNKQNTPIRSDNVTGVKGVSYHKTREKYVAAITVDGVTKHIGYYDSLEDAKLAYNNEAIKLQGGFYYGNNL